MPVGGTHLGRRYAFPILSVGLSLALGIVLLEGALRLLLVERYHVWPPNIVQVFHPRTDIMPGVSGPSTFMTSSLGLRADALEPSHADRILALGGSTTECLYLDQSETWPNLLQEALNDGTPGRTWVGNAGMSGRTTRHHLIAMRLLPLEELEIDTVILLVGVNDLSTRLAREDLYDPHFLDRDDAGRILIEETFVGGIDPRQDDMFHQRTAIARAWRRARRNLFPREPREYRHLQDDEGEVYLTWRKHRQEAAEKRSDLPDLRSALGEFARNVNGMVDIAHERGVRLILVTQPTLWRAGLEPDLEALLWLGGAGDFQKEAGSAYYAASALERGLRQYNDTLLEICAVRQVECVDLSAMLSKDTSVFYDDVHFNEAGAREVARILSNHLRLEGRRRLEPLQDRIDPQPRGLIHP
jgi:lysophospholipase L1-like esterase